MGNQQSQPPNGGKGGQKKDDKEPKKKWEPPLPTRVGKKKMRKGPDASSKLPAVFPTTRCRLKMLKMERIKDYLLMEEEFVVNQERLKPQEEKTQEERSKVDDLRGTPMSVGTLEEIIDDDHAIISTSNGPEYYVSILSFVDKDLLEPGCSILLHHKTIYDSNSGGEREIQRTMLELLNQLDGFDSRGDVKVIMATNQIESLDPALIRPGRIDRKIEFPMPDVKTKRRIFNIHTGRMQLADDVDLEEFVMSKDELSGADIKAVCTEAGLLALRERRMKVKADDFKKAKEKVLYRKNEGTPEGLYL
ncbi:hypothetical protein KVV02_005113 [Mortierella alpina]|uniref:26S proteasome regulatory subunit 4 homolog n=1 Tax=Mortierella alpina TaxID=64518 RepID=A0A9P8D1N4_MORAP|nr:hypothetical protein KVV02_005113 [Mortierella alpina]